VSQTSDDSIFATRHSFVPNLLRTDRHNRAGWVGRGRAAWRGGGVRIGRISVIDTLTSSDDDPHHRDHEIRFSGAKPAKD